MPEDAEGQERRTVEFEAYAGSIPHHSIIKGYQDSIPDGGKEVISIVKRQQLFTFIISITSILTSNFIPLLLVLPNSVRNFCRCNYRNNDCLECSTWLVRRRRQHW